MAKKDNGRTERDKRKPDWKRYEEVARTILCDLRSHFGLARVEPKQKLPGASGTVWEIDAKGIKVGMDAFVVVECRSGSSKRTSQEQLGALAFRIRDVCADGGIIVSPINLQTGAKKVAESQRIVHVRLPLKATPENFVVSFLDKVLVGCTDQLEISDSLSIIKIDDDGNRHRIV